MHEAAEGDLEKRLRDMASAWKRWGADGVYNGALHSDIVTGAADEIERLRAALSRAEAERDEAVKALQEVDANTPTQSQYVDDLTAAHFPNQREVVAQQRCLANIGDLARVGLAAVSRLSRTSDAS